VNVADVATPLAFVVAVFTPPANVALAPVAGGVKVTTTPLTGTVPLVTVATSGAPKAVLTGALCGVPLVVAIDSSMSVLLPPAQPETHITPARIRTIERVLRFTAAPHSAQQPGAVVRAFEVIEHARAHLESHKLDRSPLRCELRRLAGPGAFL
jgi:hypothetical protein